MSEGTAPVLMGLLQISRRAREVGTLQELGFVAVNETCGLLIYRQAALWVDGSSGHLQSLSGVARPDPGAPFAQWLARVFRAVLIEISYFQFGANVNTPAVRLKLTEH